MKEQERRKLKSIIGAIECLTRPLKNSKNENAWIMVINGLKEMTTKNERSGICDM